VERSHCGLNIPCTEGEITKPFGEEGQEIFLFCKTTRLVRRTTQPPNSMGTGVLSWGHRQELDIYHSPVSGINPLLVQFKSLLPGQEGVVFSSP
jgi:hypothetical protein